MVEGPPPTSRCEQMLRLLDLAVLGYDAIRPHANWLYSNRAARASRRALSKHFQKQHTGHAFRNRATLSSILTFLTNNAPSIRRRSK